MTTPSRACATSSTFTCCSPTSSTHTTSSSATTSSSPRRRSTPSSRPSHRHPRRPASERLQQRPARRHPGARCQREELRPDRRRQVHLRGRPAVEQDRDQVGDREDLRRQGRLGQHAEPHRQEAAHQVRHRQAQRHQARHRHAQVRHHRHLHGCRLGPGGTSTMAIRKYKPTTPGRRGSSVADFVEITRSTPEKSLLKPLSKSGGRNNTGRITTRHIGGGHKRQYRVIDFKRNDKDGVDAKVAHIEYDPNRTARIALLHFVDGTKRYIIAPNKLSQGDVVESGPGADIKPGNNLPLKNIPVGTVIHAIELKPGGGAKMARSAGASVRLVAKDGPYAQLRLPSGEIRNVDVRCRATIGEVGNAEQSNINWGKAGRMRWKGVRPTVRGVAMNPVDHPHGGGEGKTSGGRHPVSPWGQKEGRTRKRNLPSDKLIVRRRNVGKKRK